VLQDLAGYEVESTRTRLERKFFLIPCHNRCRLQV
jgi:hypothetical protein